MSKLFSDVQALLVYPESKRLTNYFHKACHVSVLKRHYCKSLEACMIALI